MITAVDATRSICSRFKPETRKISSSGPAQVFGKRLKAVRMLRNEVEVEDRAPFVRTAVS
jgi:hypothetical protein